MAPKNTFEPPTAISDLDNLENLYLRTYIDRLKPNEIEPHLQSMEQLKEYLFQLRYNLAKDVITPDLTHDDLEKSSQIF